MLRRLSTRFFLVTLIATTGSAPLGAEEFSFDKLREKAKALAASPHQPSPLKLDEFWKNLNYDQHRDIRFQMEKGL